MKLIDNIKKKVWLFFFKFNNYFFKEKRMRKDENGKLLFVNCDFLGILIMIN